MSARVQGYLLVERSYDGFSMRVTKRRVTSDRAVATFRLSVLLPDALVSPPLVPVELEVAAPPYPDITVTPEPDVTEAEVALA